MEKREETIKNQKALIACQIKRSIKEDFAYFQKKGFDKKLMARASAALNL